MQQHSSASLGTVLLPHRSHNRTQENIAETVPQLACVKEFAMEFEAASAAALDNEGSELVVEIVGGVTKNDFVDIYKEVNVARIRQSQEC